MSYHLFLDDTRQPNDVHWVQLPDVSWVIVRSYEEFVQVISQRGLPDYVTYDCDLCPEHYEAYFKYRERYTVCYKEFKTKCGIHCAEHLISVCRQKGIQHPTFNLHTQNNYALPFIHVLITGYNLGVNMIKEVVGNLLDTQECQIIVQQCNLFHTFGAGLALGILKKFPEAFEADKKTSHGDFNKLGTYSVAKITDPKGTSIQFVVNLYSQSGLGGKDRQTSYDAMVNGLIKLRDKLEARKDTMTVGIPFQLGCGLANGDWTIVRAIIESIFGKSRIPVIIYKLPELV